MFTAQRLFYLSYMANLMNNEPGSKPEEAAKKSAQFTEEMLKVRDSMAFLKESHPEMWSYLDSLVRVPRIKPAPAGDAATAAAPAAAPPLPCRRPPPQEGAGRALPIFLSRSRCSMPESGSTAAIRI